MKAELFLKIIALCSLPCIFLFVWYEKSQPAPHTSQIKNVLTYEAPYHNTIDANLGFVQDAHINIPIETIHGFVNKTFLLDSGATVSTLPLTAASEIGINLALSKRIALQGFSGTPTFAYLDTITLRIGNQEFTIPATFTNASSTVEYILGRKGLFDDFTVQFNHDTHTITLSRNI